MLKECLAQKQWCLWILGSFWLYPALYWKIFFIHPLMEFLDSDDLLFPGSYSCPALSPDAPQERRDGTAGGGGAAAGHCPFPKWSRGEGANGGFHSFNLTLYLVYTLYYTLYCINCLFIERKWYMPVCILTEAEELLLNVFQSWSHSSDFLSTTSQYPLHFPCGKTLWKTE